MNIKASITNMIEGKKAWRAHVARVNKLPADYQIVYNEIQNYLFKIGPVDTDESMGIFAEIVELFEDGARTGKGVLEVTGSDVAIFCDELTEGSQTYADMYQQQANEKVAAAMKKHVN